MRKRIVGSKVKLASGQKKNREAVNSIIAEVLVSQGKIVAKMTRWERVRCAYNILFKKKLLLQSKGAKEKLLLQSKGAKA